MTKKIIYLLWLAVSANSLVAQKTDSTTQAYKKGFFGRWKAEGISVAISTLQSNGKDSWLPFFYQIANTPQAKDKYNYDILTTHQHTQVSIKEQYNSLNTLSTRLTFKPIRTEHNTWVDYTEINVGIRFSNQSTLMTLWGYSEPTDSTSNYSYVKYSFSSATITPDLLYTIQTPGIGGAVALYCGVGVYSGFNVGTDLYSTESLNVSFNYSRYATKKDSSTSIFPQNTEFVAPNIVVGFYFPIGFKINLSPRSNLFFEYMYTQHIQLFNTGKQKTNLYRGVNLGYRFKFGAAKKIAKNEAQPNNPAKPPEPFY